MDSYQTPSYLHYEYSHIWEDREKVFELAIKEHSADRHLLLMLQAGELFTNLPKRDTCCEICEIVINESKEDNLLAWAYRFAAWISQEDKKDHEKALNYFLKLAEIESDDFDNILSIGKTYLALKKWDEAIEWTLKAQQDEETFNEATELLGDIYLEKKDYDTALEYYHQCHELGEYSQDLFYNTGLAYYYKKDFETARIKLLESMKLNDKDANIPYLIGVCWMSEDDFYRAMDYFTRALALQPNMPEALNGIAKLYYDFEGDYQVAIGYLEKAIEETTEPLGESMQLIYQNLGKLNLQMLNKEKADYYFRKFYECQGLEMLYDYGKGRMGYGELE